jgi:hypothetical protein
MTESVQHQELPKTIALRPRFQKLLDHNKEVVIAAFQQEKEGDSTFVISIVDDHIFIKLPRRLQHYWSPQLHLEVNDLSENSTKMYGLFGPNPTVWTMFMFLHFVVATVFFVFGIWAYSNWSLEQSYAIQLFLTLMTVVIWFALYFFGRLGRLRGKPQMQDLNAFMEQTLSKLETH